MKDEFRDDETKKPIALDAVLDTNCMMGIFSWSHVSDALEHAGKSGNGTFKDPQVAFRCQQAEELFRLSLYLHEKRLATYSVITELERVIVLDCPPQAQRDPTHAKQLNSMFVSTFSHFIKEELFYGWTAGSDVEAAKNLTDDDEVDNYLIDFAARNELPLITMEGWSRKGYNPNRQRQIPSKERAKGVTVMLPRDFYQGKLDEHRAIKRFAARFRTRMPEYLRQRKSYSDAAFEWVDLLDSYYQRLAERYWDD